MESKYLGKVYEGFEVIEYFKQNSYKKKYANDSKPVEHRAYSYILYNAERKDAITLSGNQLRLLESGARTIDEMLSARRGGYKNKQLGYFKKKYVL